MKLLRHLKVIGDRQAGPSKANHVRGFFEDKNSTTHTSRRPVDHNRINGKDFSSKSCIPVLKAWRAGKFCCSEINVCDLNLIGFKPTDVVFFDTLQL